MDGELIFREQRIEVRSHLAGTFREEIAKDVYQGLTAPQKYLPSKYFYDTLGSELFERICRLPEYYPTRTEMSILENAAPLIMDPFETGDLVELGSGANWKIRMLLKAAGRHKLPFLRYVPVDVSRTTLLQAAEELLGIYPGLEVLGIVADFTLHLDRIPSDRPRLIFFLGSTIGNLDVRERQDFLLRVSRSMRPCDRFLVGFDMLKPGKTLETAYNDSMGVTAKFNKNVLHVLNRELKADFDPSHFKHVAFFNEQKGRVEMHLQAKRRLEVNIDDLDLVVKLDRDETIQTEICNKFSRTGVKQLVDEAGLQITQWFFDSREWFSITELALKDV